MPSRYGGRQQGRGCVRADRGGLGRQEAEDDRSSSQESQEEARRSARAALDDGDHDDDDEACASHKLAVVLEEVKGRGADFRHLREVRLVDCLITDEKLAGLVAALGQGCVSVLALGGNQISNIGARTLGEALAALAPLRELHLNGNCIADPGVEALCKGLFGHLTAAEKKEQLRKAKRLQRMASAKAKRLNVKGKVLR